MIPVSPPYTRPHLRVGLYGDCNFRCTYCPPWGENSYEIDKNLKTADLAEILRSLARQGFQVVKLTGGEPTLRRDLIDIIALASGLFEEVRLITNGWNLPKIARSLLAAGLDIVEISLDALDEGTFNSLTQSTGVLPKVIAGIELCLQLGITVQLNMVVTRQNLSQVPDMLEFVEDHGRITLKLLELIYYEYPGFPFWVRNFVDMCEVLPYLEARTNCMEWSTPPGSFGTPMRMYRLANNSTAILKDGAVGAVYAAVCEGCSLFPCQDGLYGLSLTSDGILKMCKHRPDLHVRIASRGGESRENEVPIDAGIAEVVQRYESAYFLSEGWHSGLVETHAAREVVHPTNGVLRWYRTKENELGDLVALAQAGQRPRKQGEET